MKKNYKFTTNKYSNFGIESISNHTVKKIYFNCYSLWLSYFYELGYENRIYAVTTEDVLMVYNRILNTIENNNLNPNNYKLHIAGMGGRYEISKEHENSK